MDNCNCERGSDLSKSLDKEVFEIDPTMTVWFDRERIILGYEAEELHKRDAQQALLEETCDKLGGEKVPDLLIYLLEQKVSIQHVIAPIKRYNGYVYRVSLLFCMKRLKVTTPATVAAFLTPAGV